MEVLGCLLLCRESASAKLGLAKEVGAMKNLAIAMVVLAASASAAAALPAGSNSSSPFATAAGPGSSQHFRKVEAIKALRKEALKIQAEDGGKLTDAHRAQLQLKLDHILAGNY